jgi:hypothetical protein
VTNLTCEFKQYWCAGMFGSKCDTWDTGLPWFRFLELKVHVCTDADHGMCQLHKGQNFSTSVVHPPLNPLTPYGLYRSRQDYYDTSGKHLGCVDMIIPFVRQ